MKKSGILLAIIVFLAIAWGGTTYLVGSKAESHYRALLAESSQFGFVSFTSTSYERGFLTSQATTLMEVDIPAVVPEDSGENVDQEPPALWLPGKTIQVEFAHKLYHGPLPYSSGPAGRYGVGPAIALMETTLTRVAPGQQGLDNLLEELPALKDSIYISKIGVDGTTDSLVEVPPFDYALDEGSIRSNGLRVEAVYSLMSGDMSGNYDLKNVDLSLPDGGQISWQGFSGDFDLQQVLPMLYVGSSTGVMGAMEMQIPNRRNGELETVRLEQVEVASNSDYDGTMVNIDQSMTFAGLYLQEKKYGPLVIDAEFRNLDGQALSRFQQQIISLYKDVDTLDPDAMVGMLLPIYLDLFGQLLAGNPELNLKTLSLATPMGSADGSVVLKVSGLDVQSLINPAALMQSLQQIDSAAEMTIDETLVRVVMLEKIRSTLKEQLEMASMMGQETNMTDDQLEQMAVQQYEQQVEQLLAMKYVLRDGEKLTSSMTFRQGELTLNGQVLPIFNGGR